MENVAKGRMVSGRLREKLPVLLGWAGLEPGPCPLWKVTGRSQAVCRAKRPAVWSQCCQVTAGLTTWRP